MVDWITIDKNSGNSGTTVITVTASSYQELLERTTSLTVNTVNTSLSGSVAIIQQPRDVETVSVSPSTISAPASGGVYTFNIISNGAWTIEYPEWVTLSQTAGTGNATITVVVSENHSVEEYEDNIDVSTRDNTATVVVSQDRIVTHISVDPELLYFYESGGSKTITITSNAPWTASTNSEWITLSQSAGTGNGTVTVTCNSSTIDRNTSISFITLDETASTEVRQYKEEPYLYFTQSAITFDGNGGTKPLGVESNVQWEISEYEINNGLMLTNINGGSFNIVDAFSSDNIKYKYIKNFGNEVTQTGSITLSLGDILIITDILTTYRNQYPKIVTDSTYTVEGRLTDTTFSNGEYIKYQTLFRGGKVTDASGLKINTSNKSIVGMFAGCTYLVKAPTSLPILENMETGDGFANMFSGCTSLTTIPTLPSITLRGSCYYAMFSGCTSLTTAPELPATTLANYCYQSMFDGCTALTTAPTLPATTLASGCYNGMFKGCTSLTTVPALPVTTLTDSCYESMFEGCTSLRTAPALPATDLTEQCYMCMFSGCTSLISAPILSATTLVEKCYKEMFAGCTSLTTAPELPATDLGGSCYYGMFKGCTSLTTAPVLPALRLFGECYREMFYGCSSLNYIKCLAEENLTWNSKADWVRGVASRGTFVKSSSAMWWGTGVNDIPENWTVIDNTD